MDAITPNFRVPFYNGNADADPACVVFVLVAQQGARSNVVVYIRKFRMYFCVFAAPWMLVSSSPEYE